ncbi:MAG TPA: DUF3160 domain-containing protein [Polyangiaceae bacterium]|nr:DUF3160 domain-containing protein [Polyangiaceae bacterium]
MHFRTVRLLLTLSVAACAAAPPARHDVPSAGTGSALPPIPTAAPRAERPPWPSQEEICNATPAGSAASLPNVGPFARTQASCRANDSFCDSVDDAPDPSDNCFVANENIQRAARECVGTNGVDASNPPWDGATPPKYLDRIDAHLHLTNDEHRLLKNNGFVVLDRLPYVSYAAAFHDIFQEQLPLYVGIDPILHAVFAGTERVLEKTERQRLVPALASLLRKARNTLRQSKSLYDRETLADLDVFLGVAWKLSGATERQAVAGASTSSSSVPSSDALDTTPRTSLFGNDAAVEELASKAGGEGALEEVQLFGRARMIDFSQFVPRGHYVAIAAGPQGLDEYFRAMSWLSRIELNLVSRSCRSSQPGASANPAETPREARTAMALAELLERAGAAAELRLFEEVYSTFAGRREDVSPSALLRIMRSNGISLGDKEGFDKLKAAIGNGFQRTARTHYMPHGSPVLPVIATVLGPRITPDVAPLTRLVHDALPDRLELGAADVGYVLGHDRAGSLLKQDLERFPGLGAALDTARADLATQAAGRRDVYGSWLRSVIALGPSPRTVVPSFMKRQAYADARMNSALVGFGQLRHAFVLIAAQGYDAYGCEIPDAYVEPLPSVFDALVEHVRAMRGQNPGWDKLERVLVTLRLIARLEADGKALPEPHRRWLSMVAEHIPVGGFSDSGEPPKWTGWYFDMFEDREHGASKATAFVADYFTLTNKGTVQYLGAEGPRLGVFVVDTGGEPRAMVGPVAKGFETTTAIARRLDDASSVAHQGKNAAWRASYSAPVVAEPALGLQGDIVSCERDGKHEWRAAIRSDRPLRGISLTLLDHHADPLTASLKVNASDDWGVYVFDLPQSVAAASFGAEAVHLRVDTDQGPWDWSTGPGVYTEPAGYAHPPELPVRPRGVRGFAFGAPMPEGAVQPRLPRQGRQPMSGALPADPAQAGF